MQSNNPIMDQNLEEIVGVDFVENFKRPHYPQLLNTQCSIEQRMTVVRSFWKIFSENSYAQIVKFIINAYFNAEPKQLELMEILTCAGELKKFWVKIKMQFFPLIQSPESLLIAIRL